MKYFRVPSEMTAAPCYLRALKINGLSIGILFFLKDEFLQDFIRIANIKDITSGDPVKISV